MKAISLMNDIASVNLDYCIGCGLCVPTCPNEAIKLLKKNRKKNPPRSRFRLVLSMLRHKSGNWAAFKFIMKNIFKLKLYYFSRKG
jgi:Fe-S-cluster-containing hydrogenase component 2